MCIERPSSHILQGYLLLGDDEGHQQRQTTAYDNDINNSTTTCDVETSNVEFPIVVPSS